MFCFHKCGPQLCFFPNVASSWVHVNVQLPSWTLKWLSDGTHLHNHLLSIHLKFYLLTMIFLKHNPFGQFFNGYLCRQKKYLVWNPEPFWPWSRPVIDHPWHPHARLTLPFFLPATWTPPPSSAATSCHLNVACSEPHSFLSTWSVLTCPVFIHGIIFHHWNKL